MESRSSASRASPSPTATGARLTHTGLRSATTAMVTQLPTTGTPYTCPHVPAALPLHPVQLRQHRGGSVTTVGKAESKQSLVEPE